MKRQCLNCSSFEWEGSRGRNGHGWCKAQDSTTQVFVDQYYSCDKFYSIRRMFIKNVLRLDPKTSVRVIIKLWHANRFLNERQKTAQWKSSELGRTTVGNYLNNAIDKSEKQIEKIMDEELHFGDKFDI